MRISLSQKYYDPYTKQNDKIEYINKGKRAILKWKTGYQDIIFITGLYIK